MPTLEEIEEQFEKNGFLYNFIVNSREIKELPNILWEDENIEKVVSGFYDKGWGVLVASNKRIIFVDKGLFGIKVEDFPYDKVTSIQYETGMVWGKITIFASGNKADIDKVDKDKVRNFSEYVRARITGTKEHVSAPEPTETKSEADTEVLKTLKTRLAKGEITKEEYEELKQVLED